MHVDSMFLILTVSSSTYHNFPGTSTGSSPLTCVDQQPLVIPDAGALQLYLEVFEHSAITGVILLETALSHVSQLN